MGIAVVCEELTVAEEKGDASNMFLKPFAPFRVLLTETMKGSSAPAQDQALLQQLL